MKFHTIYSSMKKGNILKRKETQLRRKQQICKAYELKLAKNKLNQESKKHLSLLFNEAKYFSNYCIGLEDLAETNTKAKSVFVKIGDTWEEREFNALTAQMKQSIKDQLFSDIKGLSVKKKNGHKVGRLHFKKVVNSINLRQINSSYWINKENKKIRISGMKQWIKVRGLDQIPDNVEFANAQLIRRNGDYYLKVITFIDKDKYEENNKDRPKPQDASIGIDFGCTTQLTLSNDIKIEFEVKPTERLKRLDRKIMKNNRKDSKNKRKDQFKRKKEYEYITNCKTDIKNKITFAITTTYTDVNFQDESIHAWKSSNHGKKIQNTGIGSILANLKKKSATPIEVPKNFPSTKLCPNCGKKNILKLEERIYLCNCGFCADRDVKSALCIEREGMKSIGKTPTDHRSEIGEILTSTLLNKLSKINRVKWAKVKKQVGSLSQISH